MRWSRIIDHGLVHWALVTKTPPSQLASQVPFSPASRVPRVGGVGEGGVGVLPEIEEFLVVLDPEKEGKDPHGDHEDEEGVEPLGHA